MIDTKICYIVILVFRITTFIKVYVVIYFKELKGVSLMLKRDECKVVKSIKEHVFKKDTYDTISK